MKKLSVILMTLVMVFTVSCSKGSGDESSDKKDSTAKVDVKALANNPSDEQVVAALNQLASNVKSLAENENEALFNETVALFAALDPIMSNASENLDKKARQVLEPLMKDQKSAMMLQKVVMAAKTKVSAPASDSGDFEEDPEAPVMEAPVEMEEAEVMEVAEPNF